MKLPAELSLHEAHLYQFARVAANITKKQYANLPVSELVHVIAQEIHDLPAEEGYSLSWTDGEIQNVAEAVEVATIRTEILAASYKGSAEALQAAIN